MKKIFIFLIIVFKFSISEGQTVVSTCTAPANIVNICNRDAAKMAASRVLTINSTYKDSVVLDRPIYNRYLNALLAVYNATTLPMKDTINLLGIYANLRFLSDNDISFQADSTLIWMHNLKNNILPCGNSMIDDLINRCYLKKTNYSANSYTNWGTIVFRTDTGCNMKIVADKIVAIPGVHYVYQPGNIQYGIEIDGTDIKDSVTTNFIDLTYLIQWDDCPSSCTGRTHWKFRVYNNCSVEYLGRSGTPVGGLVEGISTSKAWQQNFKLFPNPSNDKLHIEYENLLQENLRISVNNSLGQTVYSKNNFDLNEELNISFLKTGIYYLRIEGEKGQKVFKLLKE